MSSLATCKSCGARIMWCITSTGKRMPVDARESFRGNLTLEPQPDGELLARYVEAGTGTHTSHFATCPNAAEHRNKGLGSLPGMVA